LDVIKTMNRSWRTDWDSLMDEFKPVSYAGGYSPIENREIADQEKIYAADHGEAARQALSWLNSAKAPGLPTIDRLDAVVHRVVHGRRSQDINGARRQQRDNQQREQ